jgi:hypothetical protein
MMRDAEGKNGRSVRLIQLDSARFRLLAAVAAGFGLASACGGRAEGDSRDEPSGPVADSPAEDPAPRPTRPRNEPVAAPRTPRVEVMPPREEHEVCYERDALENLPELGAIIDGLGAQALAPNGCLSGNYAGWLAGGGCQYDPNGALLRDGECCYVLTEGPPGCGRPLVIDGEVRVASLAHGAGSTLESAAAEASVPAALARAIGREWLRDALLEHASVAAFASFSLSLMAVGAPVALLAESQQASLDEIEHARACFAIADRYLGERHHAGPLDLSGLHVTTTLEEVAVRTFLDGCVEETIAALTARAQLDVARDGEVRDALERIVEDETRHAELGWKFVAWAVATGGARVTRAIEVAARGLGSEQPSVEAEPASGERRHFHDAGRLTPAERALVRERTLSLVIRPALEGILDKALESGPFNARPAGNTSARS